MRKGFRLLTVTVCSAALLTGCITNNPQMQGFVNSLSTNFPSVMNSPNIRNLIYSQCSSDYCAATLAMLGSQILNQLSQQDVSMYDSAVNRAVSTGSAQTWSNSQTGNAGQVHVRQAAPISYQEPIQVVSGQVMELPPLESVGGVYVTKGIANVRGGPSTSHAVVDRLSANEAVKVFGKVTGTSWYLIGSDDVATGYVSSSLLRKPSTQVAALPLKPEIQAAGVERRKVNVSIECRETEIDVKLQNGQTGKGTATYCNGPNGWAKEA